MANRRDILGLGAACVAASALPAWAHRLARSETEVRIKPDNAVSVIHVFHAQDVQDALFKTGLIDAPDLRSLKARARLALHTDTHFSLIVDDQPVTLEIIGAELEGDSVYVYQEGTLPGGALSVRADMLRNLIRGQINSVNIVRDGETSTLDFRGNDGVKPVA